ncbi:MAG: OadG family protein [Clostridiales bacterium]|nr:OadG family protein [Clostridiales bacterium]
MSDIPLMERFTDPSLIGSSAMSMGDRMAGSLITMLMGMGTTLAVLVLLWGIITIMTKAFVLSEKRGSAGLRADSTAPGDMAHAAAAASSPEEVFTERVDDGELAAVIAAAIAAFEGGTGADGLVVRRIRRVSGQGNAWNSAGRSDCIDSRKM